MKGVCRKGSSDIFKRIRGFLYNAELDGAASNNWYLV
jgi:hypothetical protein